LNSGRTDITGYRPALLAAEAQTAARRLSREWREWLFVNFSSSQEIGDLQAARHED